MSENEKILLERARNGDVEAFEKLIEGYQKKVFNIALRMIGNYDDASELAQEVFIRVFKAVKNFKEEASFSTWIYRITANVCLDELRRRKKKNIIYIDEDIKLGDSEVRREIEDDKPGPEVQVEKKEMLRVINEAIQSLSDQHKEIVILKDMHGLSYEEIAEILKCPEGTVKSRINRARQALKEILKTNRELFDKEFVK